jgi:hypothetical protein
MSNTRKCSLNQILICCDPIHELVDASHPPLPVIMYQSIAASKAAVAIAFAIAISNSE